jgi:hypothetical protein
MEKSQKCGLITDEWLIRTKTRKAQRSGFYWFEIPAAGPEREARNGPVMFQAVRPKTAHGAPTRQPICGCRGVQIARKRLHHKVTIWQTCIFVKKKILCHFLCLFHFFATVPSSL